MDIGLTMLPVFSAKACLNAGTYGTMGLGLGQAIAAAIVHPDRPVIHLSGDSAIGFSGMEMETLARYNLPVKIVVPTMAASGLECRKFRKIRCSTCGPTR